MQTLAAGSRNRRGFTLLELLVVMAIVALASTGVGFAMRDTAQVQLERDAQRLVAWLESARAQSQVTGAPVRWRATADGFRFEGLATLTLAEAQANAAQPWLDADTMLAPIAGSSDTPVLLLGPEPIIEPQTLVLMSRSQPGRQVRLATDGVRPFAVQPPAP